MSIVDNTLAYLNRPFVSEEGARNVRNYNYQGQDHSKIVKYMQPFWNKCATFIPANISPNIVTMVGYAIALSGCSLVILYSKTNPMIFTLYSLFLFLYQTADALDGLQGKKVGMYTNATTEIFDHGCDSNVLIMTCLASIYAFNIAGSYLSAILLISALASFYFLTWENTTTKIMIFRAGLLNPTDSLIVTQMMFFVTGFFPTMWSLSLCDILSFLFYLPAASHSASFVMRAVNFALSFTLCEIVVYSSVYTALTASYISTSFVLNYWKRKHDHPKVTAMVLRDFLKSCFVLLPIVLLVVNCVLWLIAKDSTSLHTHPIASVVALSLPWAYSIMRLIISEISETDIDTFDMTVSQLPLLLPILTQWVPFLSGFRVQAMFVSLALSALLYAHTVKKCLREVCDALSMAHFWTIPPKSDKAAPVSNQKRLAEMNERTKAKFAPVAEKKLALSPSL